MAAAPAYVSLHESGELVHRCERAAVYARGCRLCGRRCGTDRLANPENAGCRQGPGAAVHGYGPHHGEEDPLRGTRGSGTIFFSGCNLRCVFCQNWSISQRRDGSPVTAGELATMMLELQALGCHNVNLVSPSHVVAAVIEAVSLAAAGGLRLPLVYNTGGYDSPEALALLDGVIDIYMPDMKYGDPVVARRYSGVADYVAVNQAAVREMHRQVGDLVLDDRGVAVRGLLVRHLVLPGGLAGTEVVLRFVAEEISAETYVNVMDQYHPCYRAHEHPPLDRRVTGAEVRDALRVAERHGLWRLDSRWRDPSRSEALFALR